MTTPRIAIQGYEGSFHQEAAQNYFGKDIAIVTCANFVDLIQAAESLDQAEYGVMAIENSIAGSILPNYTLLEKSNLVIIGEVYLPIRHQLMVNPGVTLEDIQEVHSHYMALLQCRDYLDQYPHWKLIEASDTALSAKNIHDKKNNQAAAIASRNAAELYGMKIIAEDIHTTKTNYTRFLILKRKNETKTIPGANKASVHFTINNTKGSLVSILNIIADAGVNLSKLQSMPIAGTNFQYAFHVDMEFETKEIFDSLSEILKSHTESLKILGIYINGYQSL